MKLPDVICFPLDEALPFIKSLNFSIDEITATQPVRAIEHQGTARVVRLTLKGDAKLQIVVAYEDYPKGGV